MDEILKRLFYPYSNDEELRERIAAIHAVADHRRKKILDEYKDDHCAYRRFPIPVNELKNLSAMESRMIEARKWAVDAIQRDTISVYEFYDRKTYGNVARLMKARGSELLHELKTSPVTWDSKEYICANTEATPGSPIHFSLGGCREIRTGRDLSWMLIHEAVHHLGIEDESIADAVANGYTSECWWFQIN